jgi:lysyl-tRNA synthetase class II
MNAHVRDTMITRTKYVDSRSSERDALTLFRVIKYIERYLDDRGFLQVQTSMLQTQSVCDGVKTRH